MSSAPSTHEDKPNSAKSSLPTLEDFVRQRDFSGALTLLQHQRNTGKETLWTELWEGYAHFHLGSYDKALLVYQRILDKDLLVQTSDKTNKQGISSLFRSKKTSSEDKLDVVPTPDLTVADINLYMACCHFLLGDFEETDKFLNRATASKSPVKTRLELHLKLQNNPEMAVTNDLFPSPSVSNQLCYACLLFLSSKYEEAIEVYKKILLEKRDLIAINYYIALCYFKLDYYDLSQELLNQYSFLSDSVLAGNLKACNHYRLYNGKAAEGQLRSLIELIHNEDSLGRQLLRHNLVVFRSGQHALSVFPNLMNELKEARYNLIIYHLRQNENIKAFELTKDMKTESTMEHTLKAVVMSSIGQDASNQTNETNSELLLQSQQHFQVVGSSPSECDTIPGRQCMASYFFLTKQFDDVILYLSSIQSYFYNDDAFNFNYGQAKGVLGKFKESRDALLTIKDPLLCQDIVYLSWLTRSHVMTNNVGEAWSVFRTVTNSSHSFDILTLIANDCYKMGFFLESLKAFDLLDRLDNQQEYWEAKRGAAVGHFQRVISGDQPRDSLQEVLNILRNTKNNSQADHISSVIKKWISSSR